MTLFILTQNNVDDAKAALRAALPTVRSGHLTEALAVGLGFNTNAALRAAIKCELNKPPALADADAKRFFARLALFGYVNASAEVFTTSLNEDVLKETPYTWFRRGDHAANDRHYHACVTRHRPMLMIKMARRYAELEWDCITIDSSHDDHVTGDAGSQLGRLMFRLFQERARGAPGKPLYYASAFTGSVKNLLPHIARQLAEDYFKLLYLPLRDLPPPRLVARTAAYDAYCAGT